MGKQYISAVIKSQNEIQTDIFDLVLEVGDMAKASVPGQFVSVYMKDGSKILPRPISICGINKEEGTLRLVYRIAGGGTRELSKYEEGTKVRVLGPLGNGFTVKNKKAILIGGGIGIPPMLELSKELNQEKTMVLGYRDENLFLKDEFDIYGDVVISTEDGSVGTKGNVIDAIKEAGVTGDVIYACGPMPMLRGIKAYAAEMGIEAQISLEERMACGIGACLGCVCKSKEKDAHSHVNNKRVCKDGPVFDAQEVDI
ncbi:MAG: dihydroorotate dehydrogenase electron transfer subunit [Anaerostipes sp.]|nr:dihydroorotate dehydrogenase electron transfer subunit [Anaerostipes sp.]